MIKKVITCTTKLTFYDNYCSVVNNVLNLSLIVKLLMEDAIFDYQLGKKSNKSEFTNLYIRESKPIST